MKKSLLALAVLALSSTAFAHDSTLSGSASVSGAINNTVSAQSMVYGQGSSVSGAGSASSSAATAEIGGKKSVSYNGLFGSTIGMTGWKGSADVSIGGTTATSTEGFAFNQSTGTGTGTAHASGWSDAGSSANAAGQLYSGKGNVNIAGSLDTGKPTNVSYGPDVSVTVGTNQAAGAYGNAGGTFTARGHVDASTNYVAGQIGGSVSDTKNVQTYANAGQFNPNVTGFTGTLVNAQVFNAGSKGSVTASGQFQTSTGSLGNYVPAPVVQGN